MLQAPLPGPTKPAHLTAGGFQAETTPEEGAGMAAVALGLNQERVGKLEEAHEDVAASGKIWHAGRNHLGLLGT